MTLRRLSPAAQCRVQCLLLSMHHPRLTSHIYEMKSTSSQLAEGSRVVGAHCRPRVRLRVPDLMETLQVEM